jgi:hypothetical protein
MLGVGIQYSKTSSGQRQRIDVDGLNCKNEIDKLIKDTARDNKMNFLSNKYYNKIVNTVSKAITENKKEIHFYYNYYDFVNDGLGKPHGFLNEFMTQLCYEYSKYVTKDKNGNPQTFKILFGYKFQWELRGKNMMVIKW